MGIQMVKSCDLADHLNNGHFGSRSGFFSVCFSDHHLNTGPFDNRTQINHLNTRLVRYSDGYYKVCTGLQGMEKDIRKNVANKRKNDVMAVLFCLSCRYKKSTINDFQNY